MRYHFQYFFSFLLVLAKYYFVVEVWKRDTDFLYEFSSLLCIINDFTLKVH